MSVDPGDHVALTPACLAGKRFLDGLNSKDAQAIGELFADHFEAVGPDGTIYSRREDFVALEERGFRSMEQPWAFELTNLLPFGDNGCLMQFSVNDGTMDHFVAGAVDHFEVDEAGKIIRFIPYIAASWAHKAVENINKLKPAGA